MLRTDERRELVFGWTEDRRIHLLVRGEIGEGRQAAVEHAASGAGDVEELERSLRRIFRHRVQRRLPGPTADVWFEVG